MQKRIVVILSMACLLFGCARNHSNGAGGTSSSSVGGSSYSPRATNGSPVEGYQNSSWTPFGGSGSP